MKNKRTDDVRLFLFCAALSAHRIKDASPQLRLTFISKLLEPEVESWERTDSRAAPLKEETNNLGIGETD
jgi:hypothetical protein